MLDLCIILCVYSNSTILLAFIGLLPVSFRLVESHCISLSTPFIAMVTVCQHAL